MGKSGLPQLGRPQPGLPQTVLPQPVPQKPVQTVGVKLIVDMIFAFGHFSSHVDLRTSKGVPTVQFSSHVDLRTTRSAEACLDCRSENDLKSYLVEHGTVPQKPVKTFGVTIDS